MSGSGRSSQPLVKAPDRTKVSDFGPAKTHLRDFASISRRLIDHKMGVNAHFGAFYELEGSAEG